MSETYETIYPQEDPLYTKVKQKVTQGKRLPYREYLNRRTIHYIEHVATDEEVENVKVALANRVNYGPQNL